MKKIPETAWEVPSEEEMQQISREWWAEVAPTTFLGWNEALKDLSFPYELHKLSEKAIDAVLKVPDTTSKEEYMQLLAVFIGEFDYGDKWPAFAKLITRSPKDVTTLLSGGKPTYIDGVMDLFWALSHSERTYEDLALLSRVPENAYVVIRPYLDFPAIDEFRVYIQDRKIVGASQYYYDLDFPDWEMKDYRILRDHIWKFVEEKVIPNMTVDSFIADLVVKAGSPRITLLETNPWGTSDPCLFKNYTSFDDSLKLNRQKFSTTVFPVEHPVGTVSMKKFPEFDGPTSSRYKKVTPGQGGRPEWT